jgi:hypothetical protein
MLNDPRDKFQIPVCIADLPAADFQVSPETLTESVVAELEKTPELPGVLIVQNKKLIGLITRLKLFERLGHRYGVELFLRKPIGSLKDVIRTQAKPMPGYLKVDQAVQNALTRVEADIYDPVVVELNNKMYRLLDMNVLLLAQSRSVSNLSNIVGKLQQIDNLIYLDWETEEVFRHMLNLLGQVVPYHQAAIIPQKDCHMQYVAYKGYENVNQIEVNGIWGSAVYKLMLKHHQAVFLPDACRVPAWSGLEVLGMPSAWLGVPLLNGEQSLGLLSLGRNINSPFTSEEKETSKAFAQRIATVLLRKEKETAKTVDARHNSLNDNGSVSDVYNSFYFTASPQLITKESVF